MSEPSDELPLLRDLDRLADAVCMVCAARLCGHEAIFSVALGLKDAPRCLGCLAKGLERETADLRDQLAQHIQHRDCYRKAWNVASEREGLLPGQQPSCLWPNAEATTAPALSSPIAAVPALTENEPAVAAVWDAGDMSCGDLVLALRGRLNNLPPGAVLKVTAHDPAAPEDLPAWCRLTGNLLMRAVHPVYHIRRKER